MNNSRLPILDEKSGHIAISIIFTLLAVVALLVIIPFTQSFGAPPAGINNTENNRIVITPPDAFEPPEVIEEEIIEEDPPEFEKEIFDIPLDDVFKTPDPNGPGVKYVIQHISGDLLDPPELIFNTIDVDEVPKGLSLIKPSYPNELKRAAIEGSVLVEFIVTKQGSVRSIRIKKSKEKAFSDSVIRAIKRWKFEPGKIKNQPVATRVRQTIKFTL